MNEALIVAGTLFGASRYRPDSGLIAENPTWSRPPVVGSVSAEWDWRNGSGRLKDMAARSLLLKLETRGLVALPPAVRCRRTEWRSAHCGSGLEPGLDTEPCREAGPLTVGSQRDAGGAGAMRRSSGQVSLPGLSWHGRRESPICRHH